MGWVRNLVNPLLDALPDTGLRGQDVADRHGERPLGAGNSWGRRHCLDSLLFVITPTRPVCSVDSPRTGAELGGVAHSVESEEQIQFPEGWHQQSPAGRPGYLEGCRDSVA